MNKLWQETERYLYPKIEAIGNEAKNECKAALGHLDHQYANAKPDTTGFPLNQQHLSAVKDLRENN